MRMPTHHASACQMVEASGLLRSRPRTALTISETGWCSAKARSQFGILEVGTKALLAKVSGKSQMKPADCAASTLLTSRAINAEIHEKAKLVSMRIPAAANQERTLPCGRKPTSRPTVHITMTMNVLRTISEMVRPVRTADFAIGRE